MRYIYQEIIYIYIWILHISLDVLEYPLRYLRVPQLKTTGLESVGASTSHDSMGLQSLL
jgi:hypothetical protein